MSFWFCSEIGFHELLTASVVDVDVDVLFKLEIAHGVLLSSIKVLHHRPRKYEEAIIKQYEMLIL